MQRHRLAGSAWIAAGLSLLALAGCAAPPRPAPESTPSPVRAYDLVVRGGMLYDGTGAPGRIADVGVRGDRVVAVGDLSNAKALNNVDAHGLAVAPGFINMLSWATDTLIEDGRGLSDIRQGVTLEVFGEGWSYGPLNEALKQEMKSQQGDIRYDITWTSLGDYLGFLEHKGVSPNVASFVGATTVRQYVLGSANRAPDAAELARMQDLVREAMHEGALGVGSSLIYAPAAYAKTDELTALVRAAADSGGGYISHMRSEGDRLLESVDELVGIARATGARAEAYHLKAAGAANWPKMAQAIARIDAARAEGLSVGANMYAYTAGGTGLYACMDPAIQEGGLDAWIERLKKPAVRTRVVREMKQPGKGWENLCFLAGSPDRIVLSGFDTEKLKPLSGRTLADIAKERHRSPEDTIVDLVIEDHSRIDTVFFLMSEDNVKLGLSQPWVALGSDEGAYAPEGVFLKRKAHPRAYGNVARFLGHYVRDERVATLADGVRRLTSMPAQAWKLKDRGLVANGYFADLVVFDSAKVTDHATFNEPAQLADGVRDVFVNGIAVLRNGEHTGATPGRVVRGPGWHASP
ncbi:amidohydrolase family protein [Dokdonella sp.]|uniref:N-acyl-D-amino-acid deacylase family protein n=1 Tax=Dokdonella sp. TaxID=2291710 RepID=UPI0037845B0E